MIRMNDTPSYHIKRLHPYITSSSSLESSPKAAATNLLLGLETGSDGGAAIGLASNFTFIGAGGSLGGGGGGGGGGGNVDGDFCV